MPRQSQYVVELSRQEREELTARARRYTSPYRDLIRAKIVLLAAEGLANEVITSRLIWRTHCRRNPSRFSRKWLTSSWRSLSLLRTMQTPFVIVLIVPLHSTNCQARRPDGVGFDGAKDLSISRNWREMVRGTFRCSSNPERKTSMNSGWWPQRDSRTGLLPIPSLPPPCLLSTPVQDDIKYK